MIQIGHTIFFFNAADDALLEREIHEYSRIVADESRGDFTRNLAQKCVWARMLELDRRRAAKLPSQ